MIKTVSLKFKVLYTNIDKECIHIKGEEMGTSSSLHYVFCASNVYETAIPRQHQHVYKSYVFT
jgi:hypothetical protein